MPFIIGTRIALSSFQILLCYRQYILFGINTDILQELGLVFFHGMDVICPFPEYRL